jgi:PIN domain nuclease of toxin-antitoxin system
MLIDTHTLLWFLDDDGRLPSSIKQQIENAETVLVSIASIWEIAIKMNIGKLTLKTPFVSIQQNLNTLGIDVTPVTFADTETYLSLPLHHRDPFDRILVAQAINRNLVLVSRDALLDPYPIQRLWQ